MSNSEIKINWFPGHMKKATDEIVKKLKTVDFVIEVLDARSVELTANPELRSLIQNKPHLKVALKQDLADISSAEGVIFESIKSKSFKNKLVEALESMFTEKIERLKKKGLVNYQFIGIVIGMPNVGKSSLINNLAPVKSLIAENRAGVTKRQATKKINKNFYLVDTPGVMVRKIENIEDGYKLSILNLISKKVLPLYDVIKYNYEFLLMNYKSKLYQYFEIQNDVEYDFVQFLDYVCKKYGYVQKGNEYDYDRALDNLFNLFSNSTVTKFHF